MQVSFIVPTLNRMPHVLRAVRSCLNADNMGLTVQVVVSDAGSSDGSWEALQQEFGKDSRVVLVRSQPGCGPTENWLNGAQYVTGDYFTFVWSDDYIAPFFITELVPTLQNGAMFAVGGGLARDVDDNSEIPQDAVVNNLSMEEYLSAYFRSGGTKWPVSPACSLFSRAVLEDWKRDVERWSTANTLRQNLAWRRGIGPDLLLYLMAAARTAPQNGVWIRRGYTAQFSMHAASITISSSHIVLDVAYWIAALWYLSRDDKNLLGKKEYIRFAAAMFFDGIRLLISLHRHNLLREKSTMFAELSTLLREVATRGYRTAFIVELAATFSRKINKKLFGLTEASHAT